MPMVLSMTFLANEFLFTAFTVWEIPVPLMRRHIRAFGHVTEITKITMINPLPVIFFCDTIHFHCERFIHQVKQGGKCVTQTYTTAATMTNIINTFQFLEEICFIVIFRILPFDRMTDRRIETAFSFACILVVHKIKNRRLYNRNQNRA